MQLVKIIRLKIERELILGITIETVNFTRYLYTLNPELAVKYNQEFIVVNNAVVNLKDHPITDELIENFIYSFYQVHDNKTYKQGFK